MPSCDALIIGGGTNGLAAATRLALKGRRVTLLESGPTLGGALALSHTMRGMDARVMSGMDLARHGLNFHPALQTTLGQVRQVGSPGEVYEFPNSRFVAGFIGSVTAFDAEVAALGDVVSLDVPALGTTVQARPVPDLTLGQKVTLAIRPENLMLSRAPETGPNVIAGEVKDLAYYGKDSLYRVALPNGTLISVHAVNATRTDDKKADWYDKVWLRFDPASAIILTT